MAYKRKTKDEYEIQGNNGYGWEMETTEETYKEARAQAKCYRENVNYPIRIVKKRVRINASACMYCGMPCGVNHVCADCEEMAKKLESRGINP